MVIEVIKDVKRLNHLKSLLSPIMTLEKRASKNKKLKGPYKSSKAFEEDASRSFYATYVKITKIEE
jgi:hypothetical protein